ncbi:MAG: hypothetical protein AAF585_05405 [Verrucomicrobiota bacterium]
MNRKAAAVVSAFFLCVVGVGFWISKQSPWYSSPVDQRNERMNRALDSGNAPTSYTDPFASSSFTDSSKPYPLDEISIELLEDEPYHVWEIMGANAAISGELNKREYSIVGWEGFDGETGKVLETNGASFEIDPGRHLQLLGFGIIKPGARSISFFDPIDTQPIDAAELGVPSEWLTDAPETFVNGPILRLIFEIQSGQQHGIHRVYHYAFDQRTHAIIGNGIDNQWEAVSSDGRFAAIDAQLLTWHNTPVELAIGIPSGSPEIAMIQDLDSLISVGGANPMYLRFLVTAAGQAYSAEYSYAEKAYDPPHGGIKVEPDAPGDYLIAIHRNTKEFTQTNYLDPCIKNGLCTLRIKKQDGRIHDIWLNSWSNSVAHSYNLSEKIWDPENDQLEFRVYPELTWLWLQLPALPSLSEVSNLFDTKIPEFRIQVDEREMSRYDLADILLSKIANSTELDLDYPSGSGAPVWDSDEITIAETSPSQLLDLFLSRHPNLTAKVDHENFRLYFVEREPWPERLKSKLSETWRRVRP